MGMNVKTAQTLTLVAAVVSLTCACGLGYRNAAPVPPPPVALISANVTNLSFPDTVVGSASPEEEVIIRNNGAVPLVLESRMGDGFNGFTITSDSCSPSIDPGKHCRIGVSFKPGRYISYRGKPSLVYQQLNVDVMNHQTLTITLSGHTLPR